MSGDLDKLVRAYRRLSEDVGGRINFACDIDNDDAALRALEIAEEERGYLDQAFFVFCFAALERRINSLAVARENNAARRQAMRNAKFEKRFQAAKKVATEVLGLEPSWIASVSEIDSWYDIRNAIAHGESPTGLFDVPAVINRTREIATTLQEVTEQLLRQA